MPSLGRLVTRLKVTTASENALDCPSKGCEGGEVSWQRVEGTNFLEFDYGTCDNCGTRAGRCSNCDEITALDTGDTKCGGCLGRYSAVMVPGDADFATVTWWIPESENS